MRVLHVFKDFYPPTRGGVELHVSDVVHSMPGIQFEVLTSARNVRGSTEVVNGVRVTRAAEFGRPTSTPVTPAWIRLLRESDADVIHFHVPNPFGELAFLASRTAVPTVVTYHSDIVGRRLILPFYRPFQRRMLSKAARLIVSSPALKASPSLSRYIDRTIVVPFGVDPHEWATRPHLSDELRARHGSPMVVFLGRLAYYKGVDVLISAIRDVDAVLVVVGDGPLRDHLESNASPIAGSGRVAFTGEVSDTDRPAYYHAADVVVLPSTNRAETFGIALLEAMACGRPVISTDVGTGTSWLNVQGETGVVVRPGDPAALGSAISGILADPERARAMGAAAQERVRSRFTKRAMLDALRHVYESVAD